MYITYIKAFFQINAAQKSWLIQKNRMKIMIINSKQKRKTILGVIRNMVLDFILYS